MGRRRTVFVFNKGMNDALAVNHHIHLLQRQAVQAHGLNDFQALIHQCGAVHRNLGTHLPVGMLQCIGTGHFCHFGLFHAIKRTAGTGQNEALDLSAVRTAL